MNKLKLSVVSLFFIVLMLNGIVGAGSIQNQSNEPTIVLQKNQSTGDFYFVHITDTHVASSWYDHNETRKHWLISLLQYVTSFETPPAFVVITGDLVEWGEGFFGALNYYTFTQCFYQHDTQLYADKNCSIPVYFTPGNHDYYPYRELCNYHLFVNRIHSKDHDHYVITFKNLSLFFMNSGPNSYATYSDKLNSLAVGLTNNDIAWLDEHLHDCSTAHKIILMHHPAINLRNQDGVMYDVFIHNREQFIDLCTKYDVDAVLAGHTHEARVFDAEEHLYENLPMNTSMYPTLFVQSDDCKEGVHYRNISLLGNDIWIEPSVEVNVTCCSSLSLNLQSISFFQDVCSEHRPVPWL
jgi:3',5'-cyclic AMP phosphodiesterase CpdA